MKTIALVLALCAGVSAQGQSSQPIPPYSCGYAVLQPVLNWPPFLGHTHAQIVWGVEQQVTAVAVGMSLNKLPEPYPELAFAPGCQLLLAPDILTFPLIPWGGAAVWYIPIPNNSALAGMVFYSQAIIAGSSVGNGITMTNGMRTVIQ